MDRAMVIWEGSVTGRSDDRSHGSGARYFSAGTTVGKIFGKFSVNAIEPLDRMVVRIHNVDIDIKKPSRMSYRRDGFERRWRDLRVADKWARDYRVNLITQGDEEC